MGNDSGDDRPWWRRWWAAPGRVGGARVLNRLGTRELSFADGVGQSRMARFSPHRLVVPYTRTMLGTLALVPQPHDIGLVGLGGGSQAKFLHRHLRGARIEALEISGDVIALRRRFRIPDDDARFRVVQADAALALRERAGAYDLLLIDAYDIGGIPQPLSTARWYADCRDSLREGGALATNLYRTDVERHLRLLRNAFGTEHVALTRETEQNNCVAFAWRPPLAPAGTPCALSAAGRRELHDTLAFMRQQRIGRGASG